MKRNLLLVASFVGALNSFAQVLDTVSMGSMYANENYYKLSNDNEYTVLKDNWDLAFATNTIGGSSSTIRINGSAGVELYKYSNAIGDWSTLDTTGFNWSSSQLVNSDTSWTTGAFENTTPANGFDLGWGAYSMITHTVQGDKLFILKLANGDYKKLIVTSLISGVYSIQYADLDGGNQVNTTIDKANYVGKNFGYYSIQNGSALDREPLSENWDLLFTKYITDLGIMYYPVSGVLVNKGVKVAQVNNVPDVNTVTSSGQIFETSISTIGSDWKRYVGFYEIEDSLVYFVELPNSDIYKLIFTGFGGMTTGDFIFTREQVFATGLETNLIENKILNVYPNPASEEVNVTFVRADNETLINIVDLTGKEVFSKQINGVKGMTQERIDVNHLTKGIYFLNIVSSSNRSTQKIIIK